MRFLVFLALLVASAAQADSIERFKTFLRGNQSARADFEQATELADRVLREEIDWLDEIVLDTQRRWVGDDPSGVQPATDDAARRPIIGVAATQPPLRKVEQRRRIGAQRLYPDRTSHAMWRRPNALPSSRLTPMA